MHDFDRLIEGHPRCDFEDEAVGEKCGVECRKRPRGVERRRFDRRPHQIGSLADRHCRRAEPDTRRQIPDRGQLRRVMPVDEHETITRFGQSDLAQKVPSGCAGCRAHCARRKHWGGFERAQIEITPSLAAPARKAEFGKACEAPSALPGKPVRLARMAAKIAPERLEIRPRLGLYREVDDGTHQRRFVLVMRHRRARRTRAARAVARVPCRRTR